MQETRASDTPASSLLRTRPAVAVLALITGMGCVVLALAGYSQAVVKGIVQGLGEFLPISSSAHLILVPWFFNWQNVAIESLTFDVALHIGTLVALVIYFWHDWEQLLRAIPGLLSWMARRVRGDRLAQLAQSEYLLASVLLATIPGTCVGLALDNRVEGTLRSPLLIAGTLAIMGVLLYLADSRLPQRRELNQLSWRDALLIGLAQACALIPGVSRSGATMTMGRFLEFDRSSAARYSFLMSVPITAAAAAAKLNDILYIPASEIKLFVVGILVSAAVGALTIHFLLEYIRRAGFGVFAAYRVGLSLLIVLVFAMRGY